MQCRAPCLCSIAFLLLLAVPAFAQASAANPVSGLHVALRDLCSGVTSTVPSLSMLMVLAGSTIYASGQIMGAESRARANVWATAALTGATTGLLISTITPGALQMVYGEDVNCMAEGSHGSFVFCGHLGEKCCESGVQCQFGLICDGSAQCSDRCGRGVGQLCCPGNWCGNAPGLFCDAGSCSSACGSIGLHCCDVNPCAGPGLACDPSKICQGCGQPGMSCCTSGDKCNASASPPISCNSTANLCQSCGAGIGSICCTPPNTACPINTYCDLGLDTCQACGGTGSQCCSVPPSSSRCNNPWNSCQSSACQSCGQQNQQCCKTPGGLSFLSPPDLGCNSTALLPLACNTTIDKCVYNAPPCGDLGQMCCSSNPTNLCPGGALPPANLFCNATAFCQECGTAGNACCEVNANHPLQCNSGFACVAGACRSQCQLGALISSACFCQGAERTAGYCSFSDHYYPSLAICAGNFTGNSPATLETPCTCAGSIYTAGTCCENTYSGTATSCCADTQFGICKCGDDGICAASQRCVLAASPAPDSCTSQVCTTNAQCGPGKYCASNQSCQPAIAPAGTQCSYANTYSKNATEVHGQCASNYCRDDYDGVSDGDGSCENHEECWCAGTATACMHNAASTNSSSGICESSQSARQCSNGAWSLAACSSLGICTDTGTANGGGTCSVTTYSCSAGACAPATLQNYDSCIGTDTVSLIYYSCVSNSCVRTARNYTDSCSKTGAACSAINYACSSNLMTVSNTSGSDSCAGSGTPGSCGISQLSCTTADGSVPDRCSASIQNVASGSVCMAGTVYAGLITLGRYSAQSHNFCSGNNVVATYYACSNGNPQGVALTPNPFISTTCNPPQVCVGGACVACGWVMRDPGAGDKNWYSIASSSDGNKLVAGSSGIYATSTDGGATWTRRSSSIGNWRNIASSSDGTRLAGIPSGFIYTSTNSGASWQESGAGSGNWNDVASSSDGSRLAAVEYYGYIHTSTDGGATWTQRTSSGSRQWYGIASSSDGMRLAATPYYGYIHTSTDGGATWTEQARSGARNWFSIASSSDGTRLAAVEYPGYIHTSTNGGASWSIRADAGSRNWYDIASSSDGTKLVAGATGDYIYFSSNSGATWAAQTGAGIGTWLSVASSSDGNKVAAADGNGYVYTYNCPR